MELLPEDSLTGADLYSICSDASLAAVTRMIRAGQHDETVHVTRDDVESALDGFVPSVTKEDLAYYDSVAETMKAK